MNEDMILTIVELFISILVEGIILTMIFNWITDKSQEKQQESLKQEMQNLEKQNRFDYEQIMKAINQNRLDVISQIKESNTTSKRES